jgi:hypothetical protein
VRSFLHLQIECQQGVPIRVEDKLNYLLGRLDITLSEAHVRRLRCIDKKSKGDNERGCFRLHSRSPRLVLRMFRKDVRALRDR